MKFNIYNSRICSRAKLDNEKIKKYLLDNHWAYTNFKNADFIFINTCAFTRNLENISIKTIRNVQQKLNKNQKLIVFGCLPAINKREISKIYKGVTFLPTELNHIEKFVKSNPSIKSSHIDDYMTNVFYRENNLKNILLRLLCLVFNDDYWTSLYSNKVFYIKLSVGCLGSCSYCAEKRAKGNLESRDIKTILTEFEEGLKKGYKFFCLAADDTGCYGRDINLTFQELLKDLLLYKEDYRLVIPEFNPAWLDEPLINLFSDKRIVSLTAPIQSGSNKILKLMNRPYKIDVIIRKLIKIRKRNPNIKIGTHIIVGFPQETEKDFDETKNLLKKFAFDRIKIFKYSEREFTYSSKIRPKINQKIIDRRFLDLKKQVLLGNLKKFNLKRFIWNIDY